MYKNISIQWSWLASFILFHLLKKHTTSHIFWWWLTKKMVPIFMSPEVHDLIAWIIPEISSIVQRIPVYFNLEKSDWFIFGDHKYEVPIPNTQKSAVDLIVSSDMMYDPITHDIYIPHVPLLDIHKTSWEVSEGIYEFSTQWMLPSYTFSFKDALYFWMYQSDTITPNPHVTTFTQESKIASYQTGIYLLRHDLFFDKNTLYFWSSLWILPFFLGIGNMVAILDSIYICLYIQTQNILYLTLLYKQRKHMATMCSTNLQKMGYILIDMQLENTLKTYIQQAIELLHKNITK